MPGNYFGLVRRLVDACSWVEVIKHSACIEGARRALARAKVHWGKMDAQKLVGFTTGFSREKKSKRWENNYCWAIDRTTNNHDDIQAMIII